MLLSEGQDRLEKRIEPEPNSGCWLWTGARRGGYGRIWQSGRIVSAHRVVFELIRGTIPKGLTLDHLCRTPACVNPAHLEPVTHQVNILRGIGPAAQQTHRTHCPSGHPYDYYESGSRRRRCWVCRETGRQERDRRRCAAAKTHPCLCGCGATVSSLKINGRPRQGWIWGHNRRGVGI